MATCRMIHHTYRVSFVSLWHVSSLFTVQPVKYPHKKCPTCDYSARAHNKLYSPLDSPNAIRLLKLLRAPRGEPLRCELLQPIELHLHYNYEFKEVDVSNGIVAEIPEAEVLDSTGQQCVDHHPQYEALSYRWGGQALPIEVNGQPWTVTQYLSDALHELRLADRDRVLWVDALCINQADLAEKPGQIRLMAAIYQRAERVIAWLGPAADNSDLAMDALEGLGGRGTTFSPRTAAPPTAYLAGPHFHRFPSTWPFEDRSETTRDRLPDSGEPQWMMDMFEANEALARELGLVDPAWFDETIWVAIESLFQKRDWWGRTWIIQEVTHGREVVLHCGSRAVHWDTVHNLLRRRACWYSGRLGAALGPRFLPLDNVRSRMRNPKRALGLEPLQNSLFVLLAHYRSWSSSLSVDKIFGLLGLATFSRNIPIAVDYAQPAADVFCDTACAIIAEDQNLDVLSQVHLLEGETPSGDWPSWAPNWARNPEVNYLVDVVLGLRPFDAAGPWSSRWSRIPPDDGGRLRGPWIFYKKDPRSRFVRDGLSRWNPSPSLPAQLSSSETWTALRRPEAPRELTVEGIHWANVTWTSEALPVKTMASESLKEAIKTWFTVWFNAPIRETEQIDLRREELLQFPVDPTFLVLSLLRGQYNIPHPSSKEEKLSTTRYVTRAFLAWLGMLEDPGPAPHERYRIDFEGHLRSNLLGWKFCLTDAHHYGFVPSGARAGDAIWMVFGSCVPLVLREAPASASSDRWQQIGTGYFCHMMSGGAVQLRDKGILSSRAITLL